MLPTVQMLIQMGVHPTQARAIAGPLAAACERFDINTRTRLAGFLGQCIVESGAFKNLEESLFYTSPERILRIFPSRVRGLDHAARLARNPQALANCVYAGKIGNGDEASGDGWRFRGRGIKQLTGRANYAAAAAALGRPYLEQPDLVAQPEDACLTGAWFWHRGNCNALADSSQWDAITRAVNGPGMMDADLRRQYTQTAIEQWA